MNQNDFTPRPEEYIHRYFLVASHCNAQQELSLAMLVRQIIDVAVEHANRIHVGYSDLQSIGALWVLSRITIKIDRMPRIEENYSLLTWVESFSRIFSERNFVILDGSGRPVGYARTLWVGINLETRRPADLSQLVVGRDLTSPRECPFEAQPKLREFTEATDIEHYRFVPTDIDFNRHVNSTRYIELILNQWSLDFFDRHSISEFDIAYKSEAHYGDRAAIKMIRDERAAQIQIDGETGCYCLSKIRFSRR
ncbi:MAG: thioesterase [Clostridium sp.]|nr:thioesterase [Clostridium sp.]